MSNNNILRNKDKVAIVAVGFNRLEPMQRLLNSLNNAIYPCCDIPLVISVDCGNNSQLNEYVQEFEWKYGPKYVILHQTRLGLRNHIFSCGDLTEYFRGVIILEDDIYVSPYFYEYTINAIEHYENDEQTACIALYAKQYNELQMLPFTPRKGEYDYYATQTVITWGECWTERMWGDFKLWLHNNKTPRWELLDIPQRVKNRKRAWSNYFYAYIVENDKYVVSPYDSFTTNFNEAGEHNVRPSAIVQVPLAMRHPNLVYGPVEKLVKYDSYMNPIGLGEVLGIDELELCVNLHGKRPNDFNKRYVLTIESLPYKIVKSFGLKTRPIETNVILNIEGDGIWLYDTTIKTNADGKRRHSIEHIEYELKGFNRFFLLDVVKVYALDKIKRVLRIRK